MNYHVIAYRWGYLQESHCLLSSPSLDDCIQVAEYYPEYRGGKYGCAVYKSPPVEQAMEGEGMGEPVHYSPSIHGEKLPSYNHRCDVFNTVVCAIQSHKEYEDCAWLVKIIDDAIAQADRRNQS
jgi:hypothetical protein